MNPIAVKPARAVGHKPWDTEEFLQHDWAEDLAELHRLQDLSRHRLEQHQKHRLGTPFIAGIGLCIGMLLAVFVSILARIFSI